MCDLTVLPNPGTMVNNGNHPQMAQHFRLVKYSHLPIYIYTYTYIHIYIHVCIYIYIHVHACITYIYSYPHHNTRNTCVDPCTGVIFIFCLEQHTWRWFIPKHCEWPSAQGWCPSMMFFVFQSQLTTSRFIPLRLSYILSTMWGPQDS